MSINPMQRAHDAPRCSAGQSARRNRVVRPRCEAIVSAGCTAPEAARHRASGMGTSGTEPRRRRRSLPPGTSTRWCGWRVIGEARRPLALDSPEMSHGSPLAIFPLVSQLTYLRVQRSRRFLHSGSLQPQRRRGARWRFETLGCARGRRRCQPNTTSRRRQ